MRFLAATALLLLVAVSCNPDPEPAPPKAPPPRRLIPPLWDAKVGEWLRVEEGPASLVYRVVNAGETWIDVETTPYRDGAPTGSPQKTRWTRNSFGLPDNECVVRVFDPDRIEVKGKWYDCWRLLVSSATEQQMYWISDEIPVHGLLRVAAVHKGVADETHALKLVEWGFSE
jgi:hypothetical protein